MSQAPEGDVYLIIQDDTIIRGVFTSFKNAGRHIADLQDKNKASIFRIRAFRIVKPLIEPLQHLAGTYEK